MLSAYDQQGTLLIGWDVTREQGPFFCPECKERVVLKKGSYITHHFAHMPSSECTYGVGESEEHRKAKYQIYETLRQQPGVTKLAVERPLGKVRPDISFYWEERDYVALEMQISAVSPEEISRRTSIYTSKKIAVLWTKPYRRENMSCLTPYRTSLLERYLHALYFGNVYYWLGGELLYPIHFEPYSSIVGLQVAFDEDEDRQRIEGIRQFSSVVRNLDPGEVVRVTDLKQVWRPARQIGSFVLPRARLWMLPKDDMESGRTDNM